MITARHPRLKLSALTAALVAALPLSAAAQSASSQEFKGVIELFTSQGCASCPPADAVLASFSDQRDVVALSYNVDYWDYIGWKDQLASRQNTERQRGYAKALATGSVYTPQIVVNGTGDFVGTHEDEIRGAMASAPLNGPDQPHGHIDMAVTGDTLEVKAVVGNDHPSPPPVLVLITYQDRVETPVSKGENSGHHIVNRNAVHDFKVVGAVSPARPVEVEMPVSMLQEGTRGKVGCAAILQAVDEKGVPGRILAAARLDFES